MKSALLTFHEGISQLLVFLERNLAEQELIALLNETEKREALDAREVGLLEQLLHATTNTKQYIYIVSIVSIYGLLERLADSLVEQFIVCLGGISPSFSDLPETVQKNHLPLSLALADAALKDKFRKDSPPENIIANLHSCLSDSNSYKLNGSAFTLHRGNLNIDRINEMLANTGVSQHLRRILKTNSFSNLLKSLDPNEISANTDEEVRKVFACIDELVERRNEVSHGVVQVDDLESIELLMRRCVFVREYGNALFEVLEHELLKHSTVSGAALKMGKPIAVFNNEIVCFEAKHNISIGDRIFTLTNDNLAPVRTSIVASLEVDKAPTQTIPADPNIKFGAKVLFHARDGIDYFLIQSLRSTQ